MTTRSGGAPEGALDVRCDVTDAASVDAAFARSRRRTARSRCWWPTPASPTTSWCCGCPRTTGPGVLDTNLTGAYRVVKRASKAHAARPRAAGSCFICSVVGLTGNPGQVDYAASKAGLVGMARSLARELGSRNITFNVVAPGFIETDMTAVLTDEQQAAMVRRRSRCSATAASTRSPTRCTWLAVTRRGLRHRGRDPGRRRTWEWGTDMGILDGKRILVAGVTMDSSIGFATAKVAQEQGATVLISNFGRALGITRRIAKRLPVEPPVLELDVTDPEHLERLPALVREHVDGLDGVVHSIAYGNPETLLGGKFLTGPWDDVAQAVQVSAYSLKSLATALPAADGPRRLGRGPHLRRDGRLAGLRLDGRGQGGARVDLALPRARPRPRRASGSTWSPPARCARWPPRPSPASRTSRPCGADRSPLGWDNTDQEPTAKAVVALLSDFFPATTGEIVHVDGGYHAMGA